MNIVTLRAKVASVLEEEGDPEGFHALEDLLMRTWIRERASEKELEVWRELWGAEVPRWYA
jgi:hypothetical protein